MTSQSSASSLTKQRQSWLDLVSQAAPSAGETAVVCSAQVHSHQPPQKETAEETRLENVATQDSSGTESNEETPSAEGEDQREVLRTQNKGEYLIYAVFSRGPLPALRSRARFLFRRTLISISDQQNIRLLIFLI